MQGGCGRRKHAGAKRMQVRAWVWVLRARGVGPVDSMSAAVARRGRRGGSRREGAGEGPRPRPATKAVTHRRSSDSTRSEHTWLVFGLGLGDLIVRIGLQACIATTRPNHWTWSTWGQSDCRTGCACSAHLSEQGCARPKPVEGCRRSACWSSFWSHLPGAAEGKLTEAPTSWLERKPIGPLRVAGSIGTKEKRMRPQDSATRAYRGRVGFASEHSTLAPRQ